MSLESVGCFSVKHNREHAGYVILLRRGWSVFGDPKPTPKTWVDFFKRCREDWNHQVIAWTDVWWTHFETLITMPWSSTSKISWPLPVSTAIWPHFSQKVHFWLKIEEAFGKDRDDGLKLKQIERKALQQEDPVQGNKYDQPLIMYGLVACCSLAAAIQGMYSLCFSCPG